MNNERKIIDSVETLEAALASLKEAEKKFSTYTQEQVDKIFLAAASAANKARIPLAKMAVEETGMGVVEDKVIKNNYAAEYIYNAYKNTKTCGIIEEDKAFGLKKIAEPSALSAAVIPHDQPRPPPPYSSACLPSRRETLSSSAPIPAPSSRPRLRQRLSSTQRLRPALPRVL